MGNSCHLCISGQTSTSSNEIESISRRSNGDVMSSIITIQKNWRGYMSRRSYKQGDDKLLDTINKERQDDC
jgi:hypothetical protein